MVRFINKDLKAHLYEGSEKVLGIMGVKTLQKMTELLKFHLRHYGGITNSGLIHLLQKLTISCGITSPSDFRFAVFRPYSLKDLFMILEIILESYQKTNWEGGKYLLEFVEDINDFFITEGIPLQIRFFPQKREFYVEKIISPEVSERIKDTLENFSGNEKVFEDFKEAIKQYSAGHFEESIKSCCVALEDYFCIILNKKSCKSVEAFYKEVSKKISTPRDINDRFEGMIKFIHKYRSSPLHGSTQKKDVADPELINEIIIQFTMVILNYIKKKKEK